MPTVRPISAIAPPAKAGSKEAKARQQGEKQEELCRNLQARLKHLESVSTFYDINEKGEREYVSEEENHQIRARFRAKVKDTCGG